MRRLSVVWLIWIAACGSSGEEPIDPIAEAYCAGCSEANSCARVVTETINAFCTDETRAYYSCVTDAACDVSACEAEWAVRELCNGQAPVDRVRDRIAAFAPSANIGHRGTGPTREGHPFPENSILSFFAAMEEGANGIELDAEITMDGEVIVMHDDTLDRTTTCTGCVSEMTFDEIRSCRLLDGNGDPTEERPPSLPEVYAVIGDNALINIELKVFSAPCLTDTTGPEALVTAAIAEVTRLGGESRTFFSSFDETAAELVKTKRPDFYSALLSTDTGPEEVETALALGLDAVHPFFGVTAEVVQSALDAELQVNVWTVNTAELMQAQIDKGSTAIITDEPAVLSDLLSMTP